MAPPWRSSPVLFCLVAVALAAGAGATLVTSARAPFAPAHISTAVAGPVSDSIAGALLVAPLAIAIGFLVYRRFRGGRLPLPLPFVGAAVGILVLLSVFAVLGHYYHPSGTLGSQTSGGSGPPPPGNTSQNGSGGGGSSRGGPSLPDPTRWIPFLLPVVAALAIVGIAVPLSWTAVARRRRGGGTTGPAVTPAEAQAALAGAVAEIDAGEDPRAVIERLYLRLIERVTSMAGDLAGRTPEEIRAGTLLPLGIRPAAAIALTRLFEEARYSSHPMDRAAADRLRAAVGAAAADLARTPGVA